MRIALVFNPFSYKLHEENLRVVQKYFGLFPPLSLAWVAAIAERAGHEVRIVDARTEGLDREATLARLQDFEPQLLGFMMTTYMFRETLDWLRWLKERLQVPTVVGGYNLRVYPEASLSHSEIDFGVLESALVTFPRLLEEMEGAGRWETVPGLVWRDHGRVRVNPAPAEGGRFEDYPFPARHLLPNHLYEEFPTERKNFTVMVTSKGCPRACGFCEAGRTAYDPRRAETVLDEIESCVEEFAVREIDIFDYEFCLMGDRVKAICQGILDRKLDVTWACRARIDHVNDELLALMHRAGCRRIYYGIESGVQEILDRINKGITIEQVERTISATRRLGMKSLGFFLVGAPGETRESFEQTLDFARGLDLDYVQFSKCTAKPLTPLLARLVEETGEDYWERYIRGEVDEEALPRPWTELSNGEIDALAHRAYLRFHARFGFLLRSTLAVRSFSEFRRKFFAFLDMVFSQEARAEDWSSRKAPFRIYNPHR